MPYANYIAQFNLLVNCGYKRLVVFIVIQCLYFVLFIFVDENVDFINEIVFKKQANAMNDNSILVKTLIFN